MAPPLSSDTIEACVFDAYGTLLDPRRAMERCRGSLLPAQADRLSLLWRQKQLEYTWLRSLRGDYEDFWHITGESLDYAMASLGLTDPLLRGCLMEAFFVLDAFPDAVDAVSRIKAAGIRTAILSNGSPSMLVAATGHAGLSPVLDAVLSVDPLKVYKPHPSVYKLACDRFEAPAERICFVSANGWDASGAAHFGFRTIWLNRAGAVAEMLPGTAEATIANLGQLPPLFGL